MSGIRLRLPRRGRHKEPGCNEQRGIAGLNGGIQAGLARRKPAFFERYERRNIKYMVFPIKTCAVCGEEFELKPDKPGFANRCPECSTPEPTASTTQRRMDADERKTVSEANEARRQAIRDLLYRKDS
jgi:hypothetical protein